MNQEKRVLRSLKKNRTLYRLNLLSDILMSVDGIVILILSLIVIPTLRWYYPLILVLIYVISALIMYISQKKYSGAAYEIARAIKDQIEDAPENYTAKTRLLREQVQRNTLRSVFYCIITGIQLIATLAFAGYYLFLTMKLTGNTKTVAMICGVLIIAFAIPVLALFLHFLQEKKGREQAAAAKHASAETVASDTVSSDVQTADPEYSEPEVYESLPAGSFAEAPALQLASEDSAANEAAVVDGASVSGEVPVYYDSSIPSDETAADLKNVDPDSL